MINLKNLLLKTDIELSSSKKITEQLGNIVIRWAKNKKYKVIPEYQVPGFSRGECGYKGYIDFYIIRLGECPLSIEIDRADKKLSLKKLIYMANLGSEAIIYFLYIR